MLTAARNDMLTRVGPGTPMGALLRRYWQPIGGAGELDDSNPIKPVRLMGEDLVLYRDRARPLRPDRPPLRAPPCRHGVWLGRGAWHPLLVSWLARRRDRKLSSNSPTRHNQSQAVEGRLRNQGLSGEGMRRAVVCLSGPAAGAGCRSGNRSPGTNGFREIVLSDIPCNWFQCQENSCDPIHFEWMHDNWGARLRGGDQNAAPNI